MTSITITGKAFDEEHREHVFVRYANGDDLVSLAAIRVEPCPDCDGECGNEYVVLYITGHPDADRDLEECIAAAILRAAKVIPAPGPQLRRRRCGRSQPDDSANDAEAAAAGEVG